MTQPDPTTNSSAAEPQAPSAENTLAAEAIKEAQEKAQQYLDGWQRERAEYANYRRRTEREMQQLSASAVGDAFKAVLPVLDDFERALANVPDDIKDNPWASGVSMILRKFHRVLENNNVTILDATGQQFDPGKHEAIASEEVPDTEPGIVTATLQRGYLIGDRVLRPALVRVSR